MEERGTITAPGNELTIYFVGLCLFAKANDEDIIHVFLPQPKHIPPIDGGSPEMHYPHRAMSDMTHRATIVSAKGRGWSASEIPPGALLEYRVKGAVDLPWPKEMSNLADLPLGGTLPRKDAKPDKKLKGPHVCLYGGTLTAIDRIGVWDVDDSGGSTKEARLPYLHKWTGQADTDEIPGEFLIWNATEEESPTLGDGCRFPCPKLDPGKAAEMAAAHIQADYYIATGDHGPKMTFKGEQSPNDGSTLPSSIPACPLQTLVVASCPSLLLRLD